METSPSDPVRVAFVLGGGDAVGVEEAHDFGEIRRVEGVAMASGHAYYVIDDEGHVALRTLIFD